MNRILELFKTHSKALQGIAALLISLGLIFSALKWLIPSTPEYQLSADIKAPLAKVDTWLVNQKTGGKTYLPNAQWAANPIEVHLKNTGKKPIENLEIVIEFVATGEISLLGEEYAVKPEIGIDKIKFSEPKKTERRAKLDLFNPGDEFIYSAIGTRPVKARVYAKFPGLSFYQEYSPIGSYDYMIHYLVIIFLALSAIFGLFLVYSGQKNVIRQYGFRNIISRGLANVYWSDRSWRERYLFFVGLFITLFTCLILFKQIINN